MDTVLLEQTGSIHCGLHHGPVGHDQQVIPGHQLFATAHLQRLPSILQQGHTHATAPGNSHGHRAVMGQGRHQHALQFPLVLGGHHREVRHGPQIADVVLTLVGGAVGAHHAGTIQHKYHRQFLNAHIVNHLVVGPLQEGAVNGHHRSQSLGGHTGGQGHRMLFGDAHVNVLIR